MERMRKVFLWGMSVLASAAIILGASSVSYACVRWIHQPKVPESMMKRVRA